MHDVAQHRGARLVEVLGEIIHFCRVVSSRRASMRMLARALVYQASDRADRGHRSPFVLTDPHPLAIGARALIGLSLNPHVFLG